MQHHLDIGRDILNSDIVCYETSPIDEQDSGNVFCHICTEGAFMLPADTEALTRRTGVFTGRHRCDQGAPTYCCLQCASSFPGMFTPELSALLEALGA